MSSLIITGIDTETTGLSQQDGHRIIEISLAFYTTRDGYTLRKLGQTWTQRINPLRPIDPMAQEVHGISSADLRGAPEWEQVAPKIVSLLSKTHILVGHNMAFDGPFVGLELARIGYAVPQCETFCTMEAGRAFTALGKTPSLKELCWALDVEYDTSKAHAADYDTERTMECFERGVSWGYYKVPLIESLRQQSCMTAVA
jgi:DNA polymerase III subunit epsilon